MSIHKDIDTFCWEYDYESEYRCSIKTCEEKFFSKYLHKCKCSNYLMQFCPKCDEFVLDEIFIRHHGSCKNLSSHKPKQIKCDKKNKKLSKDITDDIER